MNGRHSFDDALNWSIDALGDGQPLEAVLSVYPQYAAALAPLLATTQTFAASDRTSPPEPALDRGLATVRAALRDARETGASQRRNGLLWSRQVRFASVSAPAVLIGVFALAGIGGAAAASVAVTQPGALTSAADAVTPDWVQHAFPDRLRHASAPGDASATPPAAAQAAAHETPQAGRDDDPGATIDEVSAEGIISEAHGDSFTLASEGGTWHVVINGDASVTGDVRDGAHATVAGRGSGDVLHAETIVADGVADAATTPTDAPADPDGRPDDNPAPDKTRTPGAGNGGEPPGQSATPPGKQDGTPPAQGTPQNSQAGRPATTTPADATHGLPPDPDGSPEP